MLAEGARGGLEKRLAQRSADEGALSPELTREYKERLEFEIDTIIKMGFAGYFLIVADFIGSSNLLPVTVAGRTSVELAGQLLTTPAISMDIADGGPATLSIRPEDVHVLPPGAEGENRIAGRVTFVRDFGASVETHVRCDGVEVISVAAPKDRPDVARDDEVTVELPPASCVVLPR